MTWEVSGAPPSHQAARAVLLRACWGRGRGGGGTVGSHPEASSGGRGRSGKVKVEGGRVARGTLERERWSVKEGNRGP